MATYLALQSTYTHIELGIYQDDARLAFIQIDKTKASKDTIPVLAALLKENNLSITDLSFIGINQGPGPFTTLRTAIATINGLAFARTLPLVGVNGMEAFLQEYTDKSKNVIALMNAFGSDLYYGIRTGNTYDEGCASIDAVMIMINQKIPNGSISFIGNGVELAQEQLKTTLGDRIQINNPNPATVSLDAIAHIALAHFKNKQNITYYLQPLYFKEAFYKL